jgi:hypothetical protein
MHEVENFPHDYWGRDRQAERRTNGARLSTALVPIVHGRHWPGSRDVRNFPRLVAACRKKGGAPILENMGWDEEVLIEPIVEPTIIESTIATNDPVRIQLNCTADVAGRTQRLTFSRTIDADATATINERDGGLNVTVNVLNRVLNNVLNVETHQEVWLGSDRKDCGSVSRHYWMDSLPCLSNRRESR